MTKISNQYSLTNVLTADPVNGRVGIGTATPAYNLDISTATVTGVDTYSSLQLQSSNYGYLIQGGIKQGAGGNMFFKANNGGAYTTTMTLTSAGNVGIGTSSPDFPNGSGLVVYATDFPRIQLRNSTTGNTSTDGAGLFMVGNDYYISNRETGNMIFENGANTERMRITSGGNVGIGTSSPNSKLQIGTMVAYTGSGYTFAMGNGTTDFLITVNAAQTGSSVTFYSSTDYYFNRSGPSSTGIINAFGFNNVSDYRLKYDLESFDGLSLISQIKTYKYKMEETHETQYGVLAHEIQEVLPHLVVGVKDGDRMQSVDYQKIVPMLIKSVQEQQLQINELKALLNA